ncbi:MAG: phage tail protein [Xanthomonadaceae bacterium]|nr:phage tail protein [Xanthomonadaceae bacterium]
MQFFSLLTTTGKAKVAQAIASDIPLEITDMALGDGGGAAVVPVENRAALIGEVNRGPANLLAVDPINPNWVSVERIIAPEVGGFTIREVGLFDAAGDLVAYGNFPDSYKPQLAEGSGKELVIKVQIEVANASAVTLQIDPSVVLATRAYVDTQDNALDAALRAYVDTQDTAQDAALAASLAEYARLDGAAFTGDVTLAGELAGFRGVPMSTITAAYTYALADSGRGVCKSVTSALTVTIPNNTAVAYPVGTILTLANAASSGNFTLAGAAGVTLRLAGTTTTGSRTVAGWGYATAFQVAANVWLVSGPGVT